MTTKPVVAGLGPAALTRSDVVLELGPHHPSTHGSLRLHLELDGDTVVSAEPLVGALHRGAEKLFEARDYRQVLVLANRHDWLSAFNNEVGIALAVERMLGMEVPPRAVWLRTLLCELNRVLSHLAFLPGGSPASLPLLPVREVLQAVLEEATGGRIHYVFTKVGGVREDVPAGWTSAAPPPSTSSAPLSWPLTCPSRPTPGSGCCRSSTPCRTASQVLSPGPVGSTWTCAATSRTSPMGRSTSRWC